MCIHALDENGIVFEVEVSRDEALATLELYKQTCPGLFSLSSLQGVLQAMDRGGVRTCTYSIHTKLFVLCSSHEAPLTGFSSCFGVCSTCL